MTNGAGRVPRAIARAHSIECLRELARRRLPRAIYDFFDGGAEDETTLAANRAAFGRLALRPRILNDVSRIDTGTPMFDRESALPIAIAPTGAAGFGRPGADVAIARAAAAAGIPYTLSSSATASIERIAREAPGRHWFQAYILRDRPFFERMIDRAEAAGFEALMITVDLPVGGKRERDLRNDFSIPFRFTARNLADFARHPRWCARFARDGIPIMENLVGMEAGVVSATGIASSVGRSYDPSFDWHRLAGVRERWPRRLIVKGVMHPADALRLLALGVDAIVVSNHGGRQLDGAGATLAALPAIARAVAGRVPVFLDGGIRRGADVVKALACGADAVMVGRATLYGAIAGGDAGARRALEILRDELERTLRLCSVTSIAAIGEDLLMPAPAGGVTDDSSTCPRACP
ncbi:MAG: alpha-hydroxy acid oxidase [Lautropia sp.]